MEIGARCCRSPHPLRDEVCGQRDMEDFGVSQYSGGFEGCLYWVKSVNDERGVEE